MSVLDKVNSPSDLKKLDEKETEELCEDIRKLLIETVSKTGGHLASNLGAVELTVAIHKVFNSPQDQIVFDVGHQCYTHKILTGRKEQFSTLRTEGGIAGFTRPEESRHDIFSSGHSSVSIAQAVGLAKAKKLRGEKGKVIAVIGDGALTGGLAYEALDNCGNDNDNLIIVLNDNNMSISQNVGTMSRHLTDIRTSPQYFTFKTKLRRAIARIPRIGDSINRFLTMVNTTIRKTVYHSTFFEDLGFRYYGPIDGHDMTALVNALNAAKSHDHSVVIHVNTIKGKGYEYAEKNPTEFHGIGKFNIETGEPISAGENFSSTFGKTMCDLAKKDNRICCITAAMTEGTGLTEFSKEYPDRFFDVAIAEQFAVTFASGLAKNGMVPVFAVYSTFLQRAYDQLIHDVAMQKLKIVFGIDRAGLVGEDGESHNGLFDTAYLNSVPNLTVYSPATYEEQSLMFIKGIYHDEGAVAVRYPRGKEVNTPEYTYSKNDFDIVGDNTNSICLVTYGREFQNVYDAYKELPDTFIIKLNKIKPLNKDVVNYLENAKKIYFFEEGVKNGGIGETFANVLEEGGISADYKNTAVDYGFVKHASVESQLKELKLDKESIINEVLNG